MDTFGLKHNKRNPEGTSEDLLAKYIFRNSYITLTQRSNIVISTVSFYMQRGADECKQRRVEHDCSIAVKRHVHRHQPLQTPPPPSAAAV